MKILSLQQNTPEWEEMRRIKIGASDAAACLRKDPFKTIFDLWEQKVLGKKTFVSAAMQRGKDLEEAAREWFCKKTGTQYEPVVAEHDELSYMIASFDGLCEEGILEIKCPGNSVLEDCKRGAPPEYWHIQIQHQLEVSGKSKASLFVYDEQNPEESPSFLFARDEALIKQILEAEREFHECMINFSPPDIGLQELIERTDPDWLEAEDAWTKAKNALEQAEELEKICREGLIYLSGDKPSKGKKMALMKIFKTGTIDYKKIPQLQGVDLEAYRKPGSSYWKIREL